MVRGKSTRSWDAQATAASRTPSLAALDLAHGFELDLDREGTLTELLRDHATASVMSPAQERRAVTRIAALRERVWAAILDQPRLAPAVVDFARDLLGVVILPAEERLAYLLDDDDDARAAARDALTAVFAEIDRDGLLLRRILAALEARLDGRCEARTLRIVDPAIDRGALAEFLDALRRDHLALEAAQGDLHRANLGLVAPIARRFVGVGPAFPELLEAGDAGLMQAVHRFDLRCELRFAVVATWWIRHAIARVLPPPGELGVH